MQVDNPFTPPPAPDKKNLFMKFQEDMTPQEAAALAIMILMSSKGVMPGKYAEFNLCFDAAEVEALYDSCLRHWEEREIPVEQGTEKDRTPPAPRVDASGKKHYSMDCDAGKLGVDLQGIGQKTG